MAARIILADGMATNRIALKSMLVGGRHEVLCASDTAEVRHHLASGGIDLLLLDLDIPGGALDLIRTLRSDPVTAHLPVIATLDRGDSALRVKALWSGADDIAMKPLHVAPLLARVRNLLRAADTRAALCARAETVRDLGFAEQAGTFAPRGRIAIVSADRDFMQAFCTPDDGGTAHAFDHVDHDTALALAESAAPPDIFVLKAENAHPAAVLQLLTTIRAQNAARHAAIVVVHDRADAETAAMALDLGANALIEEGVSHSEVSLLLDIQLRRKQESDRLRAAVEERLRLALEDPLTGLFNRRYAMAHLARVAQGQDADGACVLIADIDRFKNVNDRYGHSAGDVVLTEIARRLRNNLRAPDMVARIGGEEFLIVLLDTDPARALATAERLCEIVRDTPVALPGGHRQLSVTVSLGMAMLKKDEPVGITIDRADQALYEAKSEGRDKVTVSPGICAA